MSATLKIRKRAMLPIDQLETLRGKYVCLNILLISRIVEYIKDGPFPGIYGVNNSWLILSKSINNVLIGPIEKGNICTAAQTAVAYHCIQYISILIVLDCKETPYYLSTFLCQAYLMGVK